MKKILITVLVLLLTVSMFGCKKEKSTASLVNDAIEKTAALDSYEFNGSIYNTYEIMGFKMSEGDEYTYKAKNLTKAAEYLGKMDVYMGDSASFEVYSNKDAVYIDTGSYKVFVKPESEVGIAFDLAYLVKNFLKTLPERALNEAVVSEDDQGNTVVTVLLNDDEGAKLYRDYFDEQSSYEQQMKASGNAFKVVVTINKQGYLIYSVTSFNCKYDDVSSHENADESYETATEIILDFKDPGTKVTFDAPDISDYYDYDKLDG